MSPIDLILLNVNPIDLIWAQVKGFAARNNKNFTMVEAVQRMKLTQSLLRTGQPVFNMKLNQTSRKRIASVKMW